MKTILTAIIPLFTAICLHAAERPNFVWLISEDNSVHYLDLYHETGAPTPEISKLAKDGILFNHAFSTAPVCSTARSALATGSYGARIFTQNHRTLSQVKLPKGTLPIQGIMERAGYHTSNNPKTDYNFTGTGTKWQSKNDWRGREPGQPFFHTKTIMGTHEGKLQKNSGKKWLKEGQTDGVFVNPRHPDTFTFKNTHAAYNKMITWMDISVGKLVEELEKDGVLEDTFIFYFGDHGGVMPGSKGYVYETGLHVPLVVRIPKNFRHLVDLEPGTRTDGFVEFIDFGPTIMHLAGIEQQSGIDGKPFMGPGISREDLEARDETIGMADRFDAKIDMVRSLRKGNLKYIRNYQPFNFDGLHNNYRYRMEAYREWRDLYKAGKLNALQASFFETRPAEELYDVVKDPYETVNLATDPAYARQLVALRERLRMRLKGMPDLSFYPESHLMTNAHKNPVAFGQTHKAEIGELMDLADLTLKPFPQAKTGIASALSSPNPWKRYWGLIVCSCFMEQANAFIPVAKELAAKDEHPLVRMRAAEFLGLIGAQDPQPVILDLLATSDSGDETMLILNTVVLLQDGKPGYVFDIDPDTIKHKSGYVKRRLHYLTQNRP